MMLTVTYWFCGLVFGFVFCLGLRSFFFTPVVFLFFCAELECLIFFFFFVCFWGEIFYGDIFQRFSQPNPPTKSAIFIHL